MYTQTMNEKTIKISGTAYQRLRAQKLVSGSSIRFMIDLALDCWLGKGKDADRKRKQLR